jgi:hypothetical protein
VESTLAFSWRHPRQRQRARKLRSSFSRSRTNRYHGIYTSLSPICQFTVHGHLPLTTGRRNILEPTYAMERKRPGERNHVAVLARTKCRVSKPGRLHGWFLNGARAFPCRENHGGFMISRCRHLVGEDILFRKSQTIILTRARGKNQDANGKNKCSKRRL